MENQARALGKRIKERRLSLNLRMDDVARKANITRSTLWAIEKGEQNCSLNSLLRVMDALGLSLSIDDVGHSPTTRSRASRVSSVKDKKVNRFVIMCIEQYASSVDRSSQSVYEDLSKAGVIDDLTNDYEDLHGMSTPYLNEYMDTILRRDNDGLPRLQPRQNEETNHTIVKTILITKVIELISDKEGISVSDARNKLYSSPVIGLIDDDETGLYGESPLYVYSLYQQKNAD